MNHATASRNLIAVQAASLLLATAALAQNPAAVDQFDSTQQRRSFIQSATVGYESGTNAPEIYPGESDDVGPQSVLSLKPRRTWFTGTADSEIYYSDNAFLDHNTRVHSGIMVSTAEIAFAPTPYAIGDAQAAPRIGFRQQWYDFFQVQSYNPNLNTYDFNAQTIFAEERWLWNKWIFGAGFDYTRLLSTSSYRQFYAEYVPHWEVTRPIVITPKQVLSLSYQGYYHFTDASQFQFLPASGFFDRLDQLAVVTYSWEPCEHVVLQPYYTFRYTHFTAHINREDYLNSVGLSAYYFFNKWVSARVFTGYDQRFSSLSDARYHQFSAGTGVNFNISL